MKPFYISLFIQCFAFALTFGVPSHGYGVEHREIRSNRSFEKGQLAKIPRSSGSPSYAKIIDINEEKDEVTLIWAITNSKNQLDFKAKVMKKAELQGLISNIKVDAPVPHEDNTSSFDLIGKAINSNAVINITSDRHNILETFRKIPISYAFSKDNEKVLSSYRYNENLSEKDFWKNFLSDYNSNIKRSNQKNSCKMNSVLSKEQLSTVPKKPDETDNIGTEESIASKIIRYTFSPIHSFPSIDTAPLEMVKEDNVDITQCPKQYEIRKHIRKYNVNDFVTIGDLHGNAGKLIYFLIKEGIATLDPKDCQKLLDFYFKSSDIAEKFPIHAEIKALIHKMQIKSPPHVPNIRLIGDELADRGLNDAITIEILDYLHEFQPKYEIMMSNHSLDFFRILNGRTSAMVDSNSIRSTRPILRTRLSKKQMETLRLSMSNIYLNHLRLLSITSQPDHKPIVFSHAPIDTQDIYDVANYLGINDMNCDSLEKVKSNLNVCISLINSNFIKRTREFLSPEGAELIYSGPEPKIDILDHYLTANTSRQTTNNPLANIFWKRHDMFFPKKYSAYGARRRDTTGIKFANGHDMISDDERRAGVPESDYELDNLLGKSPDDRFYNRGEYKVLLPKPKP